MQTTTYKKLLSSLAFIALASLPFSSSAEALYKPAQFGGTADQLSDKVTLPEAFKNAAKTVALYCQTDVTVTGLTQNTLCYEATKTNLKQETLSALDGATFIPAEANGQTVPVRVQFRVVYSSTGDQPKVLLLPNLGTLQSQYGPRYFAPQERLDNKGWYEKYAENSWANAKPFFNGDRLTRVIGTVKTDGSVDSVSALDARGKAKRDADAIGDALKDTRFIPGVVDDKTTEMHYVAVVNYAE